MSGEEAEVGGGEFEGGDEEAGKFDEDALFAGAAHFEQAALTAVEGAVGDDESRAAIHVGGDFVGRVVAHGVAELYGGDEAVHVGVGHYQGAAVGGAFDEAVLEGVGARHYRVKVPPVAANEEQVADVGNVAALCESAAMNDFLRHWGEYLEACFGQLLVGGLLCVTSLEVTHDEPLSQIVDPAVGRCLRRALHFGLRV